MADDKTDLVLVNAYADINKLRARGDKANAEMRIKYNEQIDEIQEKQMRQREENYS